MNKTVNINLAGMFFHIDEDAYLKLQRYLEAIRRSFTDSQGRSEIIADIEARIAELFNERVQNERQVIGVKEVDAIITIMGQPEDYLVDDDIFEDEPTYAHHKSSSSKSTSTSSKRLFRDTENSYVGGVSSGLGHYFGIEPVWIRLIWILLIFGAGTGVLLYILLWILVPEAKTTSEILMMKGEPINISNIEKKIKDGFGSVSDHVKKNVDLKKHGDKIKEGFEHVSDSISEGVKRADFNKQGQRIKSTSTNFFETLGNIILFFFKIFAKFFGIALIIFGAVLLLGLIISLFSLGSSSYFHPWWMDYPDALNTTGMPIWLGGLILFTFFGIPIFFIAYLGLKILITNLKSIGKVAKFTLLGLWLFALFAIIFIGAKQASFFALENSVAIDERLDITTKDTLSIKMSSFEMNRMSSSDYRNRAFEITYDQNDDKVIYSRNVHITIKSTKDSTATIKVIKEAKGRDFIEARQSAELIQYKYELKNNQLLLDNFWLTDYDNKYLDQYVNVIVYLPEGKVFKMNDNTRSYLSHHNSNGSIINFGKVGNLLKVLEDDIECFDCDLEDDFKINVDIEDEDGSIKIDSTGIEARAKDSSVKVDSQGVKAKSESVRVNIDSNGIEITTDDD
ncbi:PspC domain-containing protein [Sediminibacter sp. Hel_I_10]|uniref:PspC domain-containing protein n=1 Tax=Sediminibacter sp. Hel_I_10 TaxID=1392490 RepID=UPI00047D35AE|nr:PspC domain-containing protein [Sediminibacter sp. Hel_I_10]